MNALPPPSILLKRRFLVFFTISVMVAGAGAGFIMRADANPDAGAAVSDAEGAIRVAAHKALYSIDLAGTKSGSQILNIGGRMFYEWQPSCEGWISNHRFNLAYEYADSPAMNITSEFSTFESYDGTRFDFTSQRKKDGELIEELRGHAAMGPEGGSVAYKLPETLRFDLPAGTLFPMAHTRDVLEKMKSGTSFYRAVIFDGSDQEGPVEVNAFIGRPVKPDDTVKTPNAVDAEMIAVPARQVRLAFFPVKEDESVSDYEMTMTLHENGVISDMFIEYDDFSVHQKLVALEPLENPCAKP